MNQFTYISLTIISALIFHGLLWARNAKFLWSKRRIILIVALLGVAWQFVFDPIGGLWGAWFFDFGKTLGLTFFGQMPLEDLIGAAVVSSAAACGVLALGYGPRKWI